MTEGTEPLDPQAAVTRDELFQLHEHYETVAKDERDFFFRYLNFYSGLLAAILAATLTGLLGLSRSSPDSLLELLLLIGLLIGPTLIITVSYVGYPMLAVCHLRYLQASVTTTNIREMLGLKGSVTLGEGIRQPLYKGRHNNEFVAQFDVKSTQSSVILQRAAEEEWSSEKVLDVLSSVPGSHLQVARNSLRTFKFAAIILTVVITVAVLHSILSLIQPSA
jgi:hypothetical protein